MRLTFVHALAATVVIFVSGVAVGQQTARSKFAKYLRPELQPDMSLITLEANVNLIRSHLPGTDGLSTPTIYFDPKQDRFQASTTILPELEKASLERVEGAIKAQCTIAYLSLIDPIIPKVSQDDFVLRVERDVTAEPNRRLFAECRHGNVVFP